MPRFFIPASQIADGYVNIIGDDAVHISRSLRMRVGEHITVCDMQKNEYDCELCDFSEKSVCAKIISQSVGKTEPVYTLTLFQALPKSDKLDTIIQKSVETGATKIIPFESERTIVKADNDTSREDKKKERRQKIAHEAAKQCGRGIIPTVEYPVKFSQMLNLASEYELVLFFYEGDGTESLKNVLNLQYSNGKTPKSIAVIIGSEGGFSLSEVEKARQKGFNLCSLGNRILRCETAPCFAFACLTYYFEL